MQIARLGLALAALALFGTACTARAGDAEVGAFREWLAERLAPAEAELRSFYQQRGNQIAWLDRGGASRRARQLVHALGNAPEHGLDPSRYSPADLRQRVEAVGPSSAERFALELDLSRALLRFARDVASGRVAPSELGIEWNVPAREVDLVKALALAADGSFDRAIESIEPRHPEYRALRDALKRYREIAADGGWKPLGRGAVLVPGRAAPGGRIAALATRLEREGYLDHVDRSVRSGRMRDYQPALAAAVEGFQRSRGLEPDGIVGPETLAELDVSPAARIRQVELNLERWRWMRERTDPRQLLVRLPAYELRLVENGETDVAMRVIVGKRASMSPVLADRIEMIILNPYWNIPESIAAEEIFPAIQQDPSWLGREQVDVIARNDETEELTVIDPASIDWESIDPASFPYRLRQRPGPQNPLGRLQFVFPNHFAVYLHDTPGGAAFENADRALSHGCIRVEQPRLLAARLLRGNPDWDAERIDAALLQFDRIEIALAEPVPVYLLYETAFVNEGGQMEFRRDIYGIDERLAALLAGRAVVARSR